MMKLKGHEAITVICVILGFLIALQCRSVMMNGGFTLSAERHRADTLQNELEKERESSENLLMQLDEYRESLSELKTQSEKNEETVRNLEERLKTAEVYAGLTNVYGSGVVITMKDGSMSSTKYDQNLFIIHDEDVLKVINELRASGAEAISINDERILATSEIRCAGPTISVNNKKYAAPFVIKAIGDPDTMESALLIKGGIAEYLDKWGITLEIEKSPDIMIKAYSGEGRQSYAHMENESAE